MVLGRRCHTPKMPVLYLRSCSVVVIELWPKGSHSRPEANLVDLRTNKKATRLVRCNLVETEIPYASAVKHRALQGPVFPSRASLSPQGLKFAEVQVSLIA
jgi:hypothetical protein